MAQLILHVVLEEARGAVALLWSVSLVLVALATWVLTRQGQSRWRVLQLQTLLREERARHELEQRARESKLDVYRTAAMRRTVEDLIEAASVASKRPRLKVMSVRTMGAKQ